MAFNAIARRLQTAIPKQFLPFVLHSVVQSPSSAGEKHYFFSQAFYRTPYVLSSSQSNYSSFSTSQPCLHQNLLKAIDFSEIFTGAQRNEQPGVVELVESLKKADQFASAGEAIDFIDKLGIPPEENLVFWAIWDLKDDWKLALLLFNWGDKWGCCGENNWALMIWVLGDHNKFNTAWCLIRDLHRSSMDTRRAMLVLIDRYTAANNPGEAIRTFQIMEKFRLVPDQEAYYTLLTSLCKHGNIEEAEQFMLLNKKLFPLDIECFNIILNGWCNISVDLSEAKRIWRDMAKSCLLPDATSYTHMISCISKVGNLFDCFRMYDEMKRKGWTPGVKVYNSLVYALTQDNCLKEAEKILEKIKEIGLQPDSATYNAMLVPLCEARKLEEARNILAKMMEENINPSIETYHAFLVGCEDGTSEVLRNMKKAGLGPNRDTFLLIFNKFFKLKQPEDALKVWEEMKCYEIVPDSAHYAVVVEGLAICGRLTKAREFYAEMRLKGLPDDPKLKKLLMEPVHCSSHERGVDKVFVRAVEEDNKVRYVKNSIVRRKGHGDQLRKVGKMSRGSKIS